MAKPVLLLDIDGVLNCILRSRDARPPYHVWPKADWTGFEAKFQGSPWPILYAQSVVDYFHALHDTGEVDIRWHTTWQEGAPKLAVLLGLPVWPVHPCPEFNEVPGVVMSRQVIAGKPGWWKYPAAERVLLEEGRELIWIDDDISWQIPRVHRDKMRALGPRLLIVSPDTYTGLTPKNLRTISDFLEGDPVDA